MRTSWEFAFRFNLYWLTILLSGSSLMAGNYSSNLFQAFAVKPGGKLVVSADRGAITLTPADTLEMKIEVTRTVRGASQSRAQEILKAHQVSFKQNADKVEVGASIPEKVLEGFWSGGQSFEVEYRISLPSKFNLDLKTAAGSITCANLDGEVKARTAGGSLKFGNVAGAFEGTTSAGSIRLGAVSGKLKAHTTGGSIQVDRCEADAGLWTSAGNLAVGACQGKLEAQTTGGSIELGALDGPAKAATSAGSIHVKSAQAPLRLSTTGGSISVDETREAVEASTSAGSITVAFAAQPTADSRLSTTGGSVTVKLNSELNFNVEARATGGKVTTAIPVTTTVVGEAPNSGLSGKINAGGKALVLKTTAGDIRILRE
jgi:DUF4097 and DUF4098 domain-containing protein YvlB